MDRHRFVYWSWETHGLLPVLTWTLLLVSHGEAGSGAASGHWRKLFTSDILIAGHFAFLSANSISRCASSCLERFACQSFGFSRDEAACWLYSSHVDYSTTGGPSSHTYFSSTAPGVCPPSSPYQALNGACYVLMSGARSWSEAGTVCKDKNNGRLFVADTPAKMAILAQESRVFWVGGTDVFAEGDWRWVNGRRVTEGWGAVPGNDVSKNCLFYDQGKLWEESCDVTLKYMCEVPI